MGQGHSGFSNGGIHPAPGKPVAGDLRENFFVRFVAYTLYNAKALANGCGRAHLGDRQSDPVLYPHLIVLRARVKARQQSPRLWWNDGDLIVFSRKSTNGL